MTEEVQLGLARRFDVALPWRWEIVRPFDRYGEPLSPEFATEEQAREHGRRQGWWDQQGRGRVG